MTYLPLLIIPTLFLAVTALKPRLPPSLQQAACAVCIPVAATWILLLAIYPFGRRVPTDLIAILIGMSIIGLTFKLESFYNNRQIKNYGFVRLVIIVGGLYTVWFFLEGRLREAFIAALGSLLLIVLATFFAQGRRANHHLDNCC